MQTVMTDQARLVMLILMCGLLWTLESIFPLFQFRKTRVRHAMPNLALTLIFVGTNFIISFAFANLASFSVRNGIGLFTLLGPPAWIQIIFGVLALDLFAYFAHVLLHKSRVGWQIHRVHPSDNAVDVTTAFRQHPFETVWRRLWQLSGILVFGIPLRIAVMYLILSGLNAELEHANINVKRRLDRFLQLLVVTPNMHKVHHSRHQRETDSNYSNIFSLWDRLFRTYTKSIDFNTLNYGLDGFDMKERQTVRGLLKMPFVNYRRV